MDGDDRPLWLLDVDGVINGGGRCGWHAAPHSADVTTQFGDTWRLRWAPQLIDTLHDLRGQADIVWCTTWCPSVHLLERLWGLPELPRAWTDDLHGFHAVEAKRAAASKAIADGRRLIWTDDDAFPARGPFTTQLLADAAGRALLIKPNGRRGLRPHHLDQIRSFISGDPAPDAVIHATAKE